MIAESRSLLKTYTIIGWAMSFALLGFTIAGTRFANPGVSRKTYRNLGDLESLTGGLINWREIRCEPRVHDTHGSTERTHEPADHFVIPADGRRRRRLRSVLEDTDLASGPVG